MVAEIRELCKKNGTSIKALEKELGFGNGTISRWDKNAPAIDKVQAAANYFNVPLSYLTGEEKKEEPPVQSGEPSMYYRLTPENRVRADSYLAFLLAEQQKGQT